MKFTVAIDFDTTKRKEEFVNVDIPIEDVRKIIEEKLSKMDYGARQLLLCPFEQHEVLNDSRVRKLYQTLEQLEDRLMTACLTLP